MTRVIVHYISRGFAGLSPVGHPRCGAGAALRLAQESTVWLPFTFRFSLSYWLLFVPHFAARRRYDGWRTI